MSFNKGCSTYASSHVRGASFLSIIFKRGGFRRKIVYIIAVGLLQMSCSINIPDYDLIKLIGEGGFGQIWMARDALGLYRAIKIIRYDKSKSLESYEAEQNGIRHYAPYSRKYDGLIDIHHVGIRQDEGFYYYVMDLADDLYRDDHLPEVYQPKSLRAYLDASLSRRLSQDEVLQVGIEAAEALGYLHSENLVHRDVKPDNFICVNGKWKLADIGFVTAKGGKTYVGSLGYIAPEGPGNPSADIHSLGKILYEILTGKDLCDFPECPSWYFESPGEADLFKALNKIILKAADPISQNRYQSGNELLNDLVSVLPMEPELTHASSENLWRGRHVYALLTLAMALMVSLYLQRIDDALTEAIDRGGEARIFERTRITDFNLDSGNPDRSDDVAVNHGSKGDVLASGAIGQDSEMYFGQNFRQGNYDQPLGKFLQMESGSTNREIQ